MVAMRDLPCPMEGAPSFALVASTMDEQVTACCSCGMPVCGPAIASEGGACCSTTCLKARRKLTRELGALHNAAYASLPFDRFRTQQFFHHIDLSYPGLQLVHEKPYIFVVNEFLNSAECELLLAKALSAKTQMTQQLVGESEAAARTSTGCVLHREEVAGLRRRIARLALVDETQLQPLKVSRYESGQRFAEHCDAVDGNGAVDDENDYYADGPRAARGTRGCPHPGANRFVTVRSPGRRSTP